ncbi:MAG: biotin/lipoyl-containing protein [Dehalococcoidia bacterium]|nr:biotin/lipoyl-containing protein [Dehalococcoidia bacterium]
MHEGEVSRRYGVARDAQGITLEHAGRVTRFRWPSHAALAGEYAGAEAGATELRAPMAGRIARVLRQEGDTVAANEPVVILEAMKMEHVITGAGGGCHRDRALRSRR